MTKHIDYKWKIQESIGSLETYDVQIRNPFSGVESK